MSIDLVHIRGDKPEAGEEIIKDKPYLPDTDGFKQLLKSHDNLCFEDKLKDRLECFVGNIEDDKIDDYHVVCHHIVKGREGIAELIAVKIAYLGIDVDLPRKAEEISKAQNVSGSEIAFRQFFNIVGDRYKILIVLPDLYEATSMVPDADIILLDEMVKYCKGIKIWLGGKGSWDLNHLPAYKTLFRRFDPISEDYFEAMKERKKLPVAYISYRWLGKPLDIVDHVCYMYRSKQVYYKRDKEDCQYNDNITDFMNEIREGKPVVIVFSKEYFTSYACCYEMSGIFNHDDYEERLLSIIVDEELRDDEKCYRDIIGYWEDRRKANQQEMARIPSNIEALKAPYREKEEVMLDILNSLPKVFKYIKADNAMSIKYLKDNHYEPVLDKVKEKMSRFYGNMD